MKKSVWIPLVCIGAIIATLLTAVAVFLGIMVYNKENRYNNHPSQQPRTTWATEDGKVELYFHGHVGHGTIQTAEGPVEVAVTTSVQASQVDFYYEDEYQKMTGSTEPWGHGFAWGWGEVKNNHKFVIEITSADKYFEAGEILAFYKVEE